MIVTPRSNYIADALIRLERKALSKGVRRPVRAKPNLSELFGVRVLEIKELGNLTVLKVAITESDTIIVNVGCTDAMKVVDRKYEGPLARPIIEHEDGHALILRVDVAHAGLIVGAIIDVRVRFSVDTAFPVPVVEAASTNLTVRRLARPDAPITLPATAFREISDIDIGLVEDPAAQVKAERYLAAVIAHRLHQEMKARAAQRLASAEKLIPGPTIHIEIPDESVVLETPTDTLDETDKAILTELRRLEQMPLARWMRGDVERAQRILREAN